jgi:hypothetical protein
MIVASACACDMTSVATIKLAGHGGSGRISPIYAKRNSVALYRLITRCEVMPTTCAVDYNLGFGQSVVTPYVATS